MTGAIQDIRALLWQFKKAGLRQFYWRNDALELFLARKDGCENPMLVAEPAVGPPAASTLSVVSEINAPHLGVFTPCCTPGEAVIAGAVVARIDVLGRQTQVFADRDGEVITIERVAGELVEYGDCLVQLAA